MNGPDPPLETFLKCLGVQEAKHAAEGVMGGDAVAQFEELAQPLFPGFAESLHIGETFGAMECPWSESTMKKMPGECGGESLSE